MRSLIQRSTSATWFTGALITASAVLIADCSGPSAPSADPAGASIASVPRTSGPSAPGAAATTSAARDRPLIRLDTTPEEVDRMYAGYEKCLADHGMPSKAEQAKTKTLRDYPEAIAACAAKQPEDYQEREKRENPAAFQDHQREQIRCMREHGLAIETMPEGWGYTDPARDMGSAWDDKCERQAFGG
jgi:hypothetical protein